MSDLNHTPGPWVKVKNGSYTEIRHVFNSQHHMTICSNVHGYMYSDSKFGITQDQNMNANADLIAAAPETAAERDILKAQNAELREALEQIEGLYIDGEETDRLKSLDIAQDALEAARESHDNA